MQSPELSVYMPVYNAARFVGDAVKSVLEQNYRDFEFLIVDDGSTDGSVELLQSFAAKDTRIRLLNQPHKGVAAAANYAVAEARGEFLARIDGDDIALPDRLGRQLEYLQNDPHCVAVGSRMLLIDEDALPLYVMPQTVMGHQQIDASLMRGGWAIAQPACMYRRQAIVDAGGYRPELSLHEDHDLFLRLAERGHLENLPEVLQLYRQYLGSLTYVEGPASATVMPSILSEARRRRGIDGVPAPQFGPSNPAAPLERCQQWAWMSLQAGHVRTARRYARKTLRLAPISAHSWKLMYCALRGR
jgi:glycosyltransferase involved in cell wall biosynthesis